MVETKTAPDVQMSDFYRGLPEDICHNEHKRLVSKKFDQAPPSLSVEDDLRLAAVRLRLDLYQLDRCCIADREDLERERDYARQQHDNIIKADTKEWFKQRDRADAAEAQLAKCRTFLRSVAKIGDENMYPDYSGENKARTFLAQMQGCAGA